jgi:hypothetical protein
MSATQARNDIRIFFWLPKTAGGTIAAGIGTDTRAKWLGVISPDEVPASSSEQIWVGGHTSFGDHLIYDSKPLYFTVLRDPIDRLISEFFYAHQHRPPELFIPTDKLIPSFIRLIEVAPHLNYFSYMFSTYCFEKEIAERRLPPWDGNRTTAFNLVSQRGRRRGFLTENVVFHKVDIETAFVRASRSVLSMQLIGFFDRLRETTVYLNREFGLNISLDLRMHETPSKPNLDDLPSHVVGMLKRKTEADCELFYQTRRAPAAVPRMWTAAARRSVRAMGQFIEPHAQSLRRSLKRVPMLHSTYRHLRSSAHRRSARASAQAIGR